MGTIRPHDVTAARATKRMDAVFTRMQDALIKRVQSQLVSKFASGNPLLTVDPLDLMALQTYAGQFGIGSRERAMLETLLGDAYSAGWNAALAGTQDLGPEYQASLRALVAQTEQRLIMNAVSPLTAGTVNAFTQATAIGALSVVDGTRSIDSARRIAEKQLRDRGITVYKDTLGRSWSLERYTRVVIHTQAMNAYLAGSTERWNSNGVEKVRVNGANNSCKKCAPFEGKTMWLNPHGDGSLDVEYARAQGLFHAGCRHAMSAVFDGFKAVDEFGNVKSPERPVDPIPPTGSPIGPRNTKAAKAAADNTGVRVDGQQLLSGQAKNGVNLERAIKLDERAAVLSSAGNRAAETTYRLRAAQSRTGARSYRRAERDAAVLPLEGEVRTVAQYTAEAGPARIMNDAGIPPVDVYELHPDEAGVFRRAIQRSKDGNPYSAAVYVYDADEYASMRLFLTPDGEGGFALKGDEMVSVFKGQSNNVSVTTPLVHLAVEEGARRADCFDTVLPHLYGTHGLKVTGRVKWVDEYAPDGWDKTLFSPFNDGEPDVTFMAFDEDFIDGYVPGMGDVFPSYDGAYESTKLLVKDMG